MEKTGEGEERGRYLARGQVAFFTHTSTTAPLKEQTFRDYTKTQRSLLYSLICSARWINPSIFAAKVHEFRRPPSLYHDFLLHRFCVFCSVYRHRDRCFPVKIPGQVSPAIADAPGFPILPLGCQPNELVKLLLAYGIYFALLYPSPTFPSL